MLFVAVHCGFWSSYIQTYMERGRYRIFPRTEDQAHKILCPSICETLVQRPRLVIRAAPTCLVLLGGLELSSRVEPRFPQGPLGVPDGP